VGKKITEYTNAEQAKKKFYEANL